MDPREEFFTDAFYRYSAECRRLGRLARRPPSPTERGLRRASIAAAITRLGELPRHIIHRLVHRPAHRFVARAVRSYR